MELLLIFLILLFSIVYIFFSYSQNIKKITVISSGVTLLLSTYILFKGFSERFLFNYESNYTLFNLDGLSAVFFYLSTLLIFLCFIFIWEENKILYKEYSINLLLIELLLLIVFSSNNLLLFYTAFEALLIPMFLIIGVWGSRDRKVKAVYLFFFYTLVGSIMMLIGIIYIYSITGSLNIEYISSFEFSYYEQKILWIAFFLSFASKIPLFPLHIWLPEAHVEAPTVGSVLLAGILLKLGVYGFLRFSLSLFPDASLFFSPVVFLLSIIGVLSASFTAIRQTDIKRIIAYSSIAHMNLIVLGIFSFNSLGIEGAILQSISHGFVAGGLFFLVGVLYNRYHSRSLYYYGGLVHTMPIYSILLLLLTMANIALPGTSSFVGEFLILSGIFKNSLISCVISCISVVLCGMYSLWLSNRLIFGNLKLNYTLNFKDINTREFFVIQPLILFSLILGIYPYIFSYFIDFFSLSIYFINL